jgi:hypothetical protein
MKKNLLTAAILCFLLGNASGGLAQTQRRPSDEEMKARFEKFKAEREEYISKDMKLTDEEKKVFWPLCNELQMKKFELNKTLLDETRKINRAHREKRTVAEADYKKVLELHGNIKIQEARLEQEYIGKFLQVIPSEKVFLYLQSEQNFGQKTIRDRANRNSQHLSGRHEKRLESRRAETAKRTQTVAERVEKASERAQKTADRLKARAEELRQQQSYRGT